MSEDIYLASLKDAAKSLHANLAAGRRPKLTLDPFDANKTAEWTREDTAPAPDLPAIDRLEVR